MAKDFKPENHPISSDKAGGGFDPKEFKELVKLASHERKNLQLLVEYFERKSGELEDKKRVFDSISGQAPDALKKLDAMIPIMINENTIFKIDEDTIISTKSLNITIIPVNSRLISDAFNSLTS